MNSNELLSPYPGSFNPSWFFIPIELTIYSATCMLAEVEMPNPKSSIGRAKREDMSLTIGSVTWQFW